MGCRDQSHVEYYLLNKTFHVKILWLQGIFMVKRYLFTYFLVIKSVKPAYFKILIHALYVNNPNSSLNTPDQCKTCSDLNCLLCWNELICLQSDCGFLHNMTNCITNSDPCPQIVITVQTSLSQRHWISSFLSSNMALNKYLIYRDLDTIK